MKTTIFNFLCRKYTQSADKRQQEMGLQYMTADLSKQLATFFRNQLWLNGMLYVVSWRGALTGNPEPLFDEFIQVAKELLGIRPE